MLNPYTRRPEQESGTSASMPCKRQTARTELTTFYPPSLTLLVVLSPPSATLYLQNTLAHTAGSQDRLDPNFRKKNRVTEVRLTRFSPPPRLVPPQLSALHSSLGTALFPHVRHSTQGTAERKSCVLAACEQPFPISFPSPSPGSGSPRLHTTRSPDATRHSRRFAAALMARERRRCASHLLSKPGPCPIL